MILSLMAAMAQNRVIGHGLKLPWHIPADLKRFKAITLNHVCIMGRKTFDSIEKPLPHRTNVVISKTKSEIPGTLVFQTIDEALEKYENTEEEIFILGGGEIFEQTWRRADRIYLTLIHQDIVGDIFFPEVDYSQFQITLRENHDNPVPFTFINYERKVTSSN